VTILLVCADEQRLNRLKDAIHSAGFRTISARSLDEHGPRYSYDFNAVVIDQRHRCAYRNLCDDKYLAAKTG
jgi:hypothetical protein